MAEGKGISAAALVLAASKSGGGGGGTPSEYLKRASVNGNTLTLTKKDDTTVTFTPTASEVEIDGKTIKKNQSNQLETAIGGWVETTTQKALTSTSSVWTVHEMMEIPCTPLLATGTLSGENVTVKLTGTITIGDSIYTFNNDEFTLAEDYGLYYAYITEDEAVVLYLSNLQEYGNNAFIQNEDFDEETDSIVLTINQQGTFEEVHKIDDKYINLPNELLINCEVGDMGAYSFDKTVAEVKQAYDAKKNIRLMVHYKSMSTDNLTEGHLRAVGYDDDGEGFLVRFDADLIYITGETIEEETIYAVATPNVFMIYGDEEHGWIVTYARNSYASSDNVAYNGMMIGDGLKLECPDGKMNLATVRYAATKPSSVGNYVSKCNVINVGGDLQYQYSWTTDNYSKATFTLNGTELVITNN